MIFLCCLVYAVIVPRFISYSHMILIVPAYFALKRFVSGKEAGILLFILIALQIPEHAGPPRFDIVYNFIWTYNSVLIAFGLGILYLHRVFHDRVKALLP